MKYSSVLIKIVHFDVCLVTDLNDSFTLDTVPGLCIQFSPSISSIVSSTSTNLRHVFFGLPPFHMSRELHLRACMYCDVLCWLPCNRAYPVPHHPNLMFSWFLINFVLSIPHNASVIYSITVCPPYLHNSSSTFICKRLDFILFILRTLS